MKHHAMTIALLAGLAAGCGGDGGKRAEKAPPKTEPVWDGLELRSEWKHDNFGETLRLLPGAFGPEATAGVVLAGRELMAVAADGKTPLWRSHVGTDGYRAAMEIAAVDADADGVTDLLVADSQLKATLVDGRSGAALWEQPLALDPDDPSTEIAVFGTAEEPLFLATPIKQVYAAKTGAVAWTPAIPGVPYLAAPASRRDGEKALYVAVPPATNQPHDLYALSPEGEVLFEVASGSVATALVAADLDGDGDEALVAGSPEGKLSAFGSDGTLRWTSAFELGGPSDPANTYVNELIAGDLDGDGTEELVFTLCELQWPERTQVVAVSAGGDELWRIEAGAEVPKIELTGGKLLVQVGFRHPLFPGRVIAFDPVPNASDRQLWEVQIPWFATDFASDAGEERLFVGAIDGMIRGFSLADGASLQADYVGQYLMPAIAPLGDGVVVGDESGHVAAYDRQGELLWHDLLESETPGLTQALAAVRLGGESAVAAISATSVAMEHFGNVQVYGADGTERLSAGIGDFPLDLAIADLDGDGSDEAIVGTIGDGDACTVQAWDLGKGEARWSTEVGRCHNLDVAVGADGTIAAVGSAPIHEPFVAVLDPGGERRWSGTIPETAYWVEVRGGNLFAGGLADGGEGFASRWDAKTGERRWTTRLPSAPNPADPLRPLRGNSWFGTPVPDRDGDGIDELAVTTEASEISLLDGASGERLWSLPIRHQGLELSPLHYGASVTFVPGTERTPSWLLVGQGGWDPRPTAAMAVSLEGEVLQTFANESTLRAAEVITGGDGNPRVVVATSLGLASYAVRPTE